MTLWYAAAGTAASESFWSVSDSFARLCTGLGTKTEAEPTDDPGPVFAAEPTAATATPTAIATTPMNKLRRM